MSVVVSAKGLTKTYGSFKAVDDVSFSLEENRIYGLLGRNGAGKTTIMHLLTAQLFPTGGELKVFGEEPYENNRVLSRLCFIKESQKYPETFRIRDVLETAGTFFPNWDREYALALSEQFRLPLKRKMKKLSRGMLSSVGIVIGLASRAPLTIFDEPYIGLDAVARSLFYDRLLEDYAEHPRTVILSSHLIDEVSGMLEHVLLIDNGRLLLDEDADALRGGAYSVAGTGARVEEFARGRRVIRRDSFGSLASATVMGTLDGEARGHADSLGLETAAVSLQQLIVHLTGGTSERKEAGGR
ncbi:ATP-binding cassette domain-containing protein [Cohnella sp. CFH 77786]|uniref:ABC transporter ATP-binding protein n=1 Tax=Cohnella sp. CFH 77786 TaxID=2662265 RepID=UPI001C60F8FB|nr:ABC transporter ATP-binding protein [Cohnella sp. CFH 77786]MBW5445595.1 ATP-binding cassette domain-containing protein [Cohnella sp. CFH 77786]